MASYRLKLSDGTTTIDLHGGAVKVLEEGLAMPPPIPNASYIFNPFTDGGRYSSFHYLNREITVDLLMTGASLAGLQTNIRAIHRLLNDASERQLSGYGSTVYLEYQWGDVAEQSVFFDVLRGDLELPDDYFSALLSNSYIIIHARLRLACKPFGRYTNQEIAKVDLENTQSIYYSLQGYKGSPDSHHGVEGDNWEGETFEAEETCTLAGAAIQCFRAGTITNLTLELFATSAGKPTGAALATGTVDVSELYTSSTYIGWVFVVFDTPVVVTSGVVYALIAHIGQATPNIVYWRTDTGAGWLLAGSRVYSADAGSNWTIDASDDMMFFVFKAVTDTNYQDIIATAAHGDVPAKLYQKFKYLSSNHKIWVAKRSGDRHEDDLWLDSIDIGSITNIVGGAHYLYDLMFPETGCSNYMMREAWVVPIGGNIAAESEVARMNFTLSPVPRGQFQVLARLKVDHGRIVLDKIRRVEFAEKADAASWNFSQAIVAKNVGTELGCQPEKCLRCEKGCLLDVVETRETKDKIFRHLFCLAGIEDPETCLYDLKKKVQRRELEKEMSQEEIESEVKTDSNPGK